MRSIRILFCLTAGTAAFAQGLGGLDLNALKQNVLSGQGAGSLSAALPGPSNQPAFGIASQLDPQAAEDRRLDWEIRKLKAEETGPVRFGSDLFEVRQRGPLATDGGVSEDYILGTGDQVYLNATGSAAFDLTAQVDGRGEISIPKLGAVKVGGLSLGKAKAAVQGLVARSYSRTSVDLQVVRLREIRISILGEVYKPGAYLVPSLGSLVNALSLAGGPTAQGSYRDIRVVRGGKVVFSLDLYPLRTEGLGNPNFPLQSGDTLFVPLAQNLVTVEGAFTRVVHQPSPQAPSLDFLKLSPDDEKRNAYVREYRSILAVLDPSTQPAPSEAPADAFGAPALRPPAPNGMNLNPAVPSGTAAARAYALGLTATPGTQGPGGSQPQASMPVLDPSQRQALENRLVFLKNLILDLDAQKRDDHRLDVDPITHQPRPAPVSANEPDWQRQWDLTGQAPAMSFELKAGETLKELVRYAGGLVPEAGNGPISVQTRLADGTLKALSVGADPTAESTVLLQRGDRVSAAPARLLNDRSVQVEGWARVPGTFAREDGLRVGDLLKQGQQVLPDTYLHHGEIVRTLPDGTTRFFSFDVTKALAGEPSDNLLLADRDRVELYRTDDLRLQKTVSVTGPVARPGVYTFHEGMRASDLIFRAGVPQQNADRFEAELARSQDGKPSSVQRLDLSKLLATDQTGPAALADPAQNPLLRPDDQISLFEMPGYLPHRVVTLQGEVVHPGAYALDHEHETLSEIIQRAGGLTDEAMPNAGIFLRPIGTASPGAALARALGKDTVDDPTSNGINDTLKRLNETKRNPISGQLLDSPLLHGLLVGDLNRLVVDFREALKGDPKADVELLDGDTVIIPRQTAVAYVVGETASPFAAYKLEKGDTVKDLLRLAGGTTRNADTWNIRLLKADGRIIDSWVMRKPVEPGDTILVPQRIRRDSTWQENLQALTPLAIILNTLK